MRTSRSLRFSHRGAAPFTKSQAPGLSPNENTSVTNPHMRNPHDTPPHIECSRVRTRWCVRRAWEWRRPARRWRRKCAARRGVAIGARSERAGCGAAPLARRSSSTNRIGRRGAQRRRAAACAAVRTAWRLPARRRVRDGGREGAIGCEGVEEVVEFGRGRDVLREQRLPRRRRARRVVATGGGSCSARAVVVAAPSTECGPPSSARRSTNHGSSSGAVRRRGGRRRVVHPV